MLDDSIDTKRWNIICSLMKRKGYTRAKAEIAAARALGEFVGKTRLIDDTEEISPIIRV